MDDHKRKLSRFSTRSRFMMTVPTIIFDLAKNSRMALQTAESTAQEEASPAFQACIPRAYVVPDRPAPMSQVPAVLFDMPKQRRRELWQFVKLVPKPSRQHLPIEQLTTQDADCAFCMKCQCSIYFRVGQHLVRQHMTTFHMDKIREYQLQRSVQSTTRARRLRDAFEDSESSPPSKRRVIAASEEEARKVCRLLAMWVAQSLRPMTVVEDPGFREFVRYITEDLGGISVPIPSRSKLRDTIRDLARDLRASLLQNIIDNCDEYSVSTDIWTDRRMRSYASLTLHFVDKNFAMHSWTLEVQAFPGAHTSETIAELLEGMMGRWGLQRSKCVRLLRDGASNGIGAANILGVPHMTCVAHSLHLVVAGAMIKILSEVIEEELDQAGQDTEQQQDGEEDTSNGDSGEEALEMMNDRSREEVEQNLNAEDTPLHQTEIDAMKDMRRVVQIFRNIAVYFRRSQKARNRLAVICGTLPSLAGKPTEVILDCPTRWNSCAEMLARFDLLRDAFDSFFNHCTNTILGRREFRGFNLVQPTSAQWLAIKCLLCVLDPFSAVTDMLGGSGYPTLILAFPALRHVKSELQRRDMFANVARDIECEAEEEEVIRMADRVRRAVLKLYRKRFSEMSMDVMWISYLDPRLRMDHLNAEEVLDAKELLLRNAVKVLRGEQQSRVEESSQSEQPTMLTPKKDAKARMMSALFRGNTDQATVPTSQSEQELRMQCESEFLMYVKDAATADANQDPLLWWRFNGGKYPTIAKLARKWLSCVATSVPSERVFSIGGVLVAARRASILPSLVRDIIFIAENTR